MSRVRGYAYEMDFVQGWREALNRFQIVWPDRIAALERG
jgi:hypothetical protein